MLDRIALRALKLLPKNAVSRALGEAAEVKLPGPVQGVVNRAFAEFAGIDVEESERPPEDYESLNAFFTRRLKRGARQMDASGEGDLVSPVDGRLDQYGRIDRETLFQAKGKEYRLVDLVDSGREAHRFDGGHYATLYLSPRDYHRIHAPTSGDVSQMSYIPGTLFPVNSFSARRVDELFTINERLITYIDNDVLGRIGVVKVGATCVGRIGVTYEDIETNASFRRRREMDLAEPVSVSHGDELGVFNLGSTVIVLIEESKFRFADDLQVGQPIRLGRVLGGLHG
ncbi:MAG: archaetidylserine decarboxylase [Myxococcota bacterium]